MPNVDANEKVWNEIYDWSSGGDEWSEQWGSAFNQWHGSILPRIRRFLPAGHILEIAPGRGRWTQFLLAGCDRLSVVDLSSSCIEACRARFADHNHISYFVNNGRSLAMIPDDSVDFAFSFDSLVHVDSDVIADYLADLARKLKPSGAAFIHHSNLAGAGKIRIFAKFKNLVTRSSSTAWAENMRAGGKSAGFLFKLHEFLAYLGVIPNLHWRSPTVSAGIFEAMAERAGLHCVSQEIANWYGPHMIDCMSIVVRNNSPDAAKPNTVIHNKLFMDEASIIRKIAEVYGNSSFHRETR